ncbi:MAG TPA: M57 family metalloprotease [Saprospiraceae bacterium]|nr:M57 family metalloprotease [Saprospiraceae bacterium]
MSKRFLTLAVLAFLFAGINSCSKNEVVADVQQLDQSVLNRIKALGFSSEDAIAVEGGYLVEGDIFLSQEDIFKPADIFSLFVGDEEQYNTTNLVTGTPRNIKVWIKTSGSKSLPVSYGNALDEAIARYNAENLQITFTRVSTQSEGEIDITKGSGNYLASAGFPTSSGNPYNSILVNSTAIGNQPQSTIATILAHEMGHCIGFRHTDYMSRQYSCGGSPVNEGSAGVGAIHIPGTPTGPDANSWMLSCIGSGQNRPFNSNDKIALSYLY